MTHWRRASLVFESAETIFFSPQNTIDNRRRRSRLQWRAIFNDETKKKNDYNSGTKNQKSDSISHSAAKQTYLARGYRCRHHDDTRR